MDKQLKYLNTKQIDTLAAGDNAFKLDLVNIFLEQIDEFVENMNLFLEQNNWEALGREAHTAKSSALTFGMEETGNLLKDIQNECEAEELAQISEKVKQAIANLQLAIPELNALKEELAD